MGTTGTAVAAGEPVLAVDVGGTKLAAALVDPDGTIWARRTVATPAGGSEPAVSAALAEVVRGVAAAAPGSGPVAVGIGSAGPLDPEAGTVSPVNIPAWRGYDIVAAVRGLLPGRPVFLAGDGHCMALGEHWRGAAAGSPALLGMVVSTGVGGGVVLDGRVLSGRTGNAGHIGHVVVDINGPDCPCGGRGCVEALASGPAMVRWALAHGWSPGDRPADGRSLADDARAGHPVPAAAFARAGTAVG
ncbi:MAG TPA: ROK family protein, partial [Pilimelia sp.]|nr:ROK family protein [Pilimelia sp.]